MALTVARSTFIRMGGMGNWLGKQVHPLNASKMAAVAPIQVAGMSRMRATYGEKYPYEKPWDYKNKTFNTFFQLFDSTEARLNENSKVIVVEGNVGVGKNEFAKRLAAGFDLNYIGSVPDSDCFKVQGYDLRELDEMLPPTAKFYDLKRFLADPNPEKGLAGRLQLQWYHEKFIKYAEGLQHLFNTGQGFVMVRSPFSDSVFTEALRRMGYVSANLLTYYYDLRNNSICELLKPHVTIYLDAPQSVLKERIQQRADPREVNSKVLDDRYLTTIETMYKERYLKKARESGEVMEIDWTEVAESMDMDVIIEEIQRLHLESLDSEDTKFQDWYKNSEDMLCHYRKYFGSKDQMHALFARAYHWDCPEIAYSEEDLDIFTKVVYKHPVLTEDLSTSERLGKKPWMKFFT